MSLHVLMYLSSSTQMVDRGELGRILETARVRNARLGVTGVLLFSSGQFVQVLEGPKAAVTTIFNLIQDDGRHKDVEILVFEPTPERLFDKWQLGSINLDAPSDDVLRTRLEIALKQGLNGDHASGTRRALALLREFRREAA